LATGLSTICSFDLISSNHTTITGFTINTTYFLRIFTNASFDTPGTFTIRLNTIANAITLASGSTTQTLCQNTPIATITYNTTGATGATFSDLPSGVNGSWVNNVVTLSGTPTVSGPFSYTVTLAGGCSTITSNGTFSISPALGTVNSITGNANIIAGTTEGYSITSVSGSPTYQWDYLDGPFSLWVNGVSSTNTASIPWPQNSTTGAQVRVTVSNSCGSEQRILSITVEGALPVELLYFVGKELSNTNLLEWSTASEYNSDYFLVEVSKDGENWNTVSHVDAAMNSNQKLNYSTYHYFNDNIYHYYRLLQYDFDGQSKAYGPIGIDNRRETKRILKYINTIGQEVTINTTGVIIIVYEDGTISKTIK
jgi:hypothetical protein